MSPLLEYSKERRQEQLKVFEMWWCSPTELTAEMRRLVGHVLSLFVVMWCFLSSDGWLVQWCVRIWNWQRTQMCVILRMNWCQFCSLTDCDCLWRCPFIWPMFVCFFLSVIYLDLFLQSYKFIFSGCLTSECFVLKWNLLFVVVVECCLQPWYQMLWNVVCWCLVNQYQLFQKHY